MTVIRKIKIFLIFAGLAFVLLFFISNTAFAQSYFPLVPCGRSDQGGQPCNQCDFLKLGKNLIDFVLFFLVPVIGTLLIIISGFMILLGGAYPATISRGKTIFWNVIVGIAIISVSWLIVNFLLKSLGGDEIIPGEPWYKLTCQTEVTTITGVPGAKICAYVAGNGIYACIDGSEEKAGQDKCGEVSQCSGKNCSPLDPSFCGRNSLYVGVDVAENKDLAASILSNSNIALSTSADCGGSNHAKQTILDMKEGKYPPVCSANCSSSCVAGGQSGSTTVNPKILERLLVLAESYNFTITSLTTGDHSANSAHYTGEAVDIAPNSSDPSVWRAIRSALNGFGGTAICEEKTGEGGNNESCDLSKVNHIHWTLRRLATTVEGGTCTGVACQDSDLNICGENSSANCAFSTVNNWDSQIKSGASGKQICSGVDTVKLIKAIMSQESGGNPSLTAGDGLSYGILQLKPSTANQFKSGCTTENIDSHWLLSPVNVRASVCIASNYLKSLVGPCGCDIRQLAAGYNGGGADKGACNLSQSCASCSMCGSEKTKRWECLWDGPDGEHKSCNIERSGSSFNATRKYVPKVSYCYGEF